MKRFLNVIHDGLFLPLYLEFWFFLYSFSFLFLSLSHSYSLIRSILRFSSLEQGNPKSMMMKL